MLRIILNRVYAMSSKKNLFWLRLVRENRDKNKQHRGIWRVDENSNKKKTKLNKKKTKKNTEGRKQLPIFGYYTHTHTHTYIYIYIYKDKKEKIHFFGIIINLF